MHLHKRAHLSKTFLPADIAAFHALCGGTPSDIVPEPLINALFSALLGMQLPGPGTKYLKQSMHYLLPLQIGTQVLAEIEISQLRHNNKLADLRTICSLSDGTLIAEGRALVLYDTPPTMPH